MIICNSRDMNLDDNSEVIYSDFTGVNEPDDIDEEDMEDLHMFAQKLRDNKVYHFQFDNWIRKNHGTLWSKGDTAKLVIGDKHIEPDKWIWLNDELDKYIAETSEEA